MLAFRCIITSILITVFALVLLKDQRELVNKCNETMEEYFNADNIIDKFLTDGVPKDFDESSLRFMLTFMAIYGGTIAMINYHIAIVVSIYRMLITIAYMLAIMYFVRSIMSWVRGYKEYKTEREILQVI